MKRTVLFFATIVLTLPLLRADSVPTQLNEMTIAELQKAMAKGQLTSVALTQYYFARIKALDQSGPNVNSVIELNPDALAMAQNADNLRKTRQSAWSAPRYSGVAQR